MNKKTLNFIFMFFLFFNFIIFSQVKDQGMTDKLHPKMIGKIIFSNKTIDFGKGEMSKVKNEFMSNEQIHFRAYFESSFYNKMIKDNIKDDINKRNASLKYVFYINDKKLKEVSDSIHSDDQWQI